MTDEELDSAIKAGSTLPDAVVNALVELQNARKLMRLMPLVIDTLDLQWRQAMTIAEFLTSPNILVQLRERPPVYPHERARETEWKYDSTIHTAAQEMLQRSEKREALINKLRALLATIPNKTEEPTDHEDDEVRVREAEQGGP